jgi:hypothetical protein
MEELRDAVGSENTVLVISDALGSKVLRYIFAGGK